MTKKNFNLFLTILENESSGMRDMTEMIVSFQTLYKDRRKVIV